MSGRIESFKDRLQMAHPDYVVAPEETARFPLHEPVYALTEGLTAQADGQGGARRAGEACRRCRNGRMPAFLKQRKVGAVSTRRWRRRTCPVHDSDLSPDHAGAPAAGL